MMAVPGPCVYLPADNGFTQGLSPPVEQKR
jgi:hypothetical protein